MEAIIAEKLREYFKSHGVRQAEVAEVLGVSQSTLSNILAGRFPLSAKNAKALADKYELSFTYLLTGEGDLERNLRKVGNVSGGAVTQGDDSPIINQNDELVRHLQEEVKFLRETIASMTKNCK